MNILSVRPNISMITIICSMKDLAGMNMFERFVERGFKPTPVEWAGKPIYKKDNLAMVRVPEDIIHARDLDALNAEHLIFASRHKAESDIATLTVHHTGVFGEANPDYGGNDHELCWINPDITRNIYLELLGNPFEKYQVSLEVTHHGPTHYITPLSFVELGSSEEYWKDEKAADFLVNCILKGLERKDKAEHAIGIGGNHYAATFSPLEKEYAFGHICPKYTQENLDEKMLKQMFEKSHASRAFIDGKGTKAKATIKEMIEKLGFEHEII